MLSAKEKCWLKEKRHFFQKRQPKTFALSVDAKTGYTQNRPKSKAQLSEHHQTHHPKQEELKGYDLHQKGPVLNLECLKCSSLRSKDKENPHDNAFLLRN